MVKRKINNNTKNLLIHCREDVEVSSGQEQTPNDENALQNEDHVSKVVEQAHGDVDPEAEEEVTTAKDCQRTWSLERGGNQFDLKKKKIKMTNTSKDISHTTQILSLC